MQEQEDKERKKKSAQSMWVMDSGCSKHMTFHKELLGDFIEQAGPSVTFGDNSKGITKGFGTLETDFVSISNVSFVDGLKHNLLSIGQFCDNGFSVRFDAQGCRVKNIKTKEILLLGNRSPSGSIYYADWNSCPPQTCLVSKSSPDVSWLWHKRLNHLNFKTMNRLARQEHAVGIPNLVFNPTHVCSACQLGKLARASFSLKLTPSTDRVLQLIHMDLFGPVTPKSINGNEYTLVVTDDYSRYTWVIFMAHKNETRSELPRLMDRIANQQEKRIVTIRSDRGTEFLNETIIQYCEKNGIEHQTSAARTPQQNGVAERRNRTLKDAATSMLVSSALPKRFWAEAINTACYTQN